MRIDYKNWYIYQTPNLRSELGHVQLIANTNNNSYKLVYDLPLRSTKKQLYKYLKWLVDNKLYLNDVVLKNNQSKLKNLLWDLDDNDFSIYEEIIDDDELIIEEAIPNED